MKRQTVKSSNIKSIGYKLNQKILEVEFISGSIYQYFNVPEKIFNELMQAKSKGKYFIGNIRKVYMFKKEK